MKNQPTKNKPTKPLPPWIVVTAKDPKLKEAIQTKLAQELEKRTQK